MLVRWVAWGAAVTYSGSGRCSHAVAAWHKESEVCWEEGACVRCDLRGVLGALKHRWWESKIMQTLWKLFWQLINK